MDTFLTACILFGTLALTVNGQSNICFAPATPFELAATRQANQNDPNQYFIIGGMFDVYNKGATAYTCATEMSEMGFINMLAFFWGINYFFNQILGTRSVSVGAVAFDNCMRADQTIENMYDFAQCRINIGGIARENLVAYIGPYMNEDAERAGALATDLGITVFSPMADSEDINFVDQKTLLKMRPSFNYDLQAIVFFLGKVKASNVIILYSGSDPYSIDAYEELSRQINNSNTGVQTNIQYAADVDNGKMDATVKMLIPRTFVKYIIPLMSRVTLSALMNQMSVNDLNKFIFILNSRIGRDLPLLATMSYITNNTIIIDLTIPNNYQNILNSFSAFVSSLSVNNTVPGLSENVGNTWIKNYMAQKTLPALNTDTVPKILDLSVYRTLQSVQAIIQGMDQVMLTCGTTSNYQFCNPYRNQFSKSDNLYMELKNALNLHMSTSGDLKFENINYSYFIFTITSTPNISQIGYMNVTSTGSAIAFINTMSDTSLYGYAFCDNACPNTGQCCEVTTTPVPTTTVTSRTDTTVSTQSTTNGYSQVNYPTGQVITGAYASSNRMDSEYGTRFDIGQKWIIALGVLAGLGILCVVVFEIYILYKLLGTREGRQWRTIWLGQLLLFGIFLCFLVLFAFLPIPTKATCGITRFGVGVSYAFCFAVLLVKLMVILTSKPSTVLTPGEIESTNYLKGSYQFLLFIFAVGVQVVIDIQWLITVPPEAVFVTTNNGEMAWVCNHYTWQAGSVMTNMTTFVRTNFENHLMSLIYIMIMILITTILALKAHGIITNNRESIFVGIAAGFTIPIWLAWGLVGGLNKDHAYAHEFGDACIAYGLLITAALILFAMFLPKVRHLVSMGIEGIYLEDDRETIYGGSVILAPPSYKSKGSGSVIYVNNQGIYSEPVIMNNGDPLATHLKHPGSVYSAPGGYLRHPESVYGGTLHRNPESVYGGTLQRYPESVYGGTLQRHTDSVYGGAYLKNPESVYGGSTRVLRVTDDLRGRPLQKRSQSEVAYGASRKSRSHKGTLPRSRSQTNLGAL